MRCPDCRGDIPQPSPTCPHCGRVFPGMVRQLARPTVQQQVSAPPPPQPRNLREWLAANPQVVKIVAAAMAGAIVASILPHISWILGAVVGGALMLGKLKKG